MKRYAELIGNYKKQKIKNFYDNNMDYYNNEDNEGEIFFQLINLSPVDIILHKGDKIGQGIIKQYFITEDDNATFERVGGFGSTGV